jgi:hypothetical protein
MLKTGNSAWGKHHPPMSRIFDIYLTSKGCPSKQRYSQEIVSQWIHTTVFDVHSIYQGTLFSVQINYLFHSVAWVCSDKDNRVYIEYVIILHDHQYIKTLVYN